MSSEERPIVRCICFDVTFKDMLEEGCKSLSEVVERWSSSTKCGLCKPYIERTLATGEVRHAIIEDPG
jgi:NAD(P)H-nitrite reductase large subunit